MTNVWLTTEKGRALINLDLVISYDFTGSPTVLTVVTGGRISVAETFEELKKVLKPTTL